MIECNCCPTPDACRSDALCWNAEARRMAAYPALKLKDCWHNFENIWPFPGVLDRVCKNCGQRDVSLLKG